MAFRWPRFLTSVIQRGKDGEPVGSSHSFGDGGSAASYPVGENRMAIQAKGPPASGRISGCAHLQGTPSLPPGMRRGLARDGGPFETGRRS